MTAAPDLFDVAAEDRMTRAQAQNESAIPPQTRLHAHQILLTLIRSGDVFTIVEAKGIARSVRSELRPADREIIDSHSSYYGTLVTEARNGGWMKAYGRAKREGTSRRYVTLWIGVQK